MEYRLLGGSGLKVSVLTMGTMTFGGKGPFAKVGNASLDEVRRLIDLVADAGVNLIDTADVYSAGGSEALIGEAMGGKREARHADRHQGAILDGQRAERPRSFALAFDRGLRSEPEAAAHRRDRPLSGPSVGRADAARGDDGGARQSRSRRQGALHRLLEFFRLARDEGDGGRAPRRAHSLRLAADSLHAAGARGRIRADSDRARPETRGARLEPDRGRPAFGQASAQQGRARGHAADRGLDRAADRRRRQALGHRRGAGRNRRRAEAYRPPKSPWPGSSGAPA